MSSSYAGEDSLKSVLALLPRRLAQRIALISEGLSVEELRLRVARPLQIVAAEDELISELAPFSVDEARELLERLCQHSVYAHADELRQGFVTLEGGARVGVCGKPAVERGEIVNLTEVYGFNIRIARQVTGCAKDAMRLIAEGGRAASTLIAAPPGGGKTTLLRDIMRCVSEGEGIKAQKVAAADERGELAGCVSGVPSFDIGRRTDVMDRAPKSAAISLLIRSMSPEVIITDEIGGPADAAAIAEADRCGVTVIASAHADTLDELRRRQGIAPLFEGGVFKRVLMLKRRGSILRITPVLL